MCVPCVHACMSACVRTCVPGCLCMCAHACARLLRLRWPFVRLLANISVGTHIQKHYPATALLRRHPTPPATNFDRLIRLTADRFPIDVSTSKQLADSLDKAVDSADPYFNTLLRICATRCMTQAATHTCHSTCVYKCVRAYTYIVVQAVYFPAGECKPSEFHHYGLAAPIYTHFTSPIRRCSP